MRTVSQPRTGRIGQSAKAGMRAAEYTTPSDFCRTFKQDMNRLYLLSLLLTGGRRSAVLCV